MGASPCLVPWEWCPVAQVTLTQTEPSLCVDVQSGSTLDASSATDNGLISDLFFI